MVLITTSGNKFHWAVFLQANFFLCLRFQERNIGVITKFTVREQIPWDNFTLLILNILQILIHKTLRSKAQVRCVWNHCHQESNVEKDRWNNLYATFLHTSRSFLSMIDFYMRVEFLLSEIRKHEDNTK